jgi:hypothetical protein
MGSRSKFVERGNSMVKYRQTKLDDFEEYKELIKGVPIVKFKWETNSLHSESQDNEGKRDQ